MTEQTAPGYRSAARGSRATSGVAVGLTVFAAVMMVMGGLFHVLAGVTALFENQFYVAAPNYLYEVDVTAWGWIHLIGGVVVGLAGIALLSGATWARVVGITLAMLSAVANFVFLPYYPLWSLLIIALDVLVIWALAAHGRDVRTWPS